MPKIIPFSLMLVLLFGGINITNIFSQELSVLTWPSKCFAEKSGIIKAKFANGQSPFIFILSKDSLRKSEIKRSPLLSEGTFTFTNVAAGKYFITSICGDGSVFSQVTLIEQPSQLVPGKISVEVYPGSSAAMDGVIKANPVGGTLPYSFSWQGASAKGTENKISGVGNGIYKCSIKDSNGCGPVSATIFLGTKPASKSTSLLRLKWNVNKIFSKSADHQLIS